MKAPKMSVGDLAKTAEEMAANAIILEPRISPVVLAGRLVSEAEPDFVEELARSLMIVYFIRVIRAERAKQARKQRQELLFPGFEHLPMRILGNRDKTVTLARATFSDVRRYYKRLSKKYTERKTDMVKVAEAKALMDKMEKFARKEPGITVGDVLGKN